jgi:hypothetical protein
MAPSRTLKVSKLAINRYRRYRIDQQADRTPREFDPRSGANAPDVTLPKLAPAPMRS